MRSRPSPIRVVQELELEHGARVEERDERCAETSREQPGRRRRVVSRARRRSPSESARGARRVDRVAERLRHAPAAQRRNDAKAVGSRARPAESPARSRSPRGRAPRAARALSVASRATPPRTSGNHWSVAIRMRRLTLARSSPRRGGRRARAPAGTQVRARRWCERRSRRDLRRAPRSAALPSCSEVPVDRADLAAEDAVGRNAEVGRLAQHRPAGRHDGVDAESSGDERRGLVEDDRLRSSTSSASSTPRLVRVARGQHELDVVALPRAARAAHRRDRPTRRRSSGRAPPAAGRAAAARRSRRRRSRTGRPSRGRSSANEMPSFRPA